MTAEQAERLIEQALTGEAFMTKLLASPAEAVSCYLRTEMDRLVLGNYYVRQRSIDAEKRAQAAFAKLHAIT